MKSVAICGNLFKASRLCDAVETVQIEGIPISFGRVETAVPVFDPKVPDNQAMVLIKVRAFSCNYRDKALILHANQACRSDLFCYIGSEFVGEVIAIGTEVKSLAPGDRVIANSQYPESGTKDVNPGMPTNEASQRYWIIHEVKLLKIPQAMSDIVAAAFSLGAQTTYSMLRKLNLSEGCNVLVTAARSNTSLFAINALKKYRVNVYATSTSMRFNTELREMGVKDLFHIDATLTNFSDNEGLKNIISKIGGFDYVIDPFFDLHIGKLIDVMKFSAKYITCGLYDQSSSFTGKQFHYRGKALSEIMTYAVVKNIQFMGNCLGQTEDLKNALEDYTAGALDVIVDSVFSTHNVGAFFERTYNAKDRFGKVVYQYTDTE